MLLLIFTLISVVNGLYCGNIEYRNVLLELKEYMGLWYEYSHSENFIFEKGCKSVTANYTLSNTIIDVDNSCVKDGKIKHTIGTATPDDQTEGRLNVKFFVLLPTAPYDVIYVDEQYKTAVVLSCFNGIYNMWFLSRYSQPSKESIMKASKAVSQFDLTKQVLMEQK